MSWDKENVMERVLKENPYVPSKEFGFRIDGRVEWFCKHGVGHTVFAPIGSDLVHGCDGCCKNVSTIKVVDTSPTTKTDKSASTNNEIKKCKKCGQPKERIVAVQCNCNFCGENEECLTATERENGNNKISKK